MKHLSKRGLFSIPNLMGYFRLVMIPVFVWLYLHAVTDTDYYGAVLITGIPFITDTLGGVVAGRFNMVTKFGKFLDPPADRLTHSAILLRPLNHCPLIPLLVVLFAAKGRLMFVMGAIKLRQSKKLDGAVWFGKCYTTLLFVILLLFLLFLHMPIPLANGLILLCGAVMVVIPVMYIQVFRRVQGRS